MHLLDNVRLTERVMLTLPTMKLNSHMQFLCVCVKSEKSFHQQSYVEDNAVLLHVMAPLFTKVCGARRLVRACLLIANTETRMTIMLFVC